MATEAVDTRKFLSETKFYEGYSRYIEDQGRYETWDEAVDRVLEMHEENYKQKNNELKEYFEEARHAYKEQRVLGAQRALQFGGDQLMKHQMRMYNCTSSYSDRAEFFGELFYILLCGAGAGFSVQKHHVKKLPKLQARTKQAKGYIVEDSIEGWASALDVLMSSYFVGGGKHPDYEGRRVFFDMTNIRPKGAKISGGFKAPGPEGLRRSLDKIEHLLQGIVLDSKQPVAIKPINVYDIAMHAADAVLSGGVRRSATICLFSPDDEEMMNAKTGNWFMDNPQRGRSNNSAVIVRDKTTPEQFGKIMESVKQFGEPGFVFVESTEHTTNPCVEIGMFPQIGRKSGWQGCNLTEINGGMCNTEEDFYKACRAASILGTLQAGYTDFKFLSDTSKKIFDREALLGVSITGWMNNPDILFNEKVLEKGAKIVRDINKKVASIIGINPAARTTCVKPSGNASVLLQTASGIHAEHSSMYIRNVQLNKESEITQAIIKSNPYMVEESVWSAGGTDVVVSFPILPKEGSIYKDELLGVKHLELVAKAQKHWVNAGTNEDLCADKGIRHNVSNTIIVDDWDQVEKYVFENRHSFAGISFLAMSGDKDYNQAPNTAVITAKEMVKKYNTAAIFASGLVVDALHIFDNLWNACTTAQGYGEDLSLESAENAMKKDWVRRFNNFAVNYLNGDIKKAEYCLKDAYLLHKWNKIQDNLKPINWLEDITEKKYTDVDTMGAAACAGGACEIDF
jgi:ribonucleoside-diphosphate reductase alpha chain